MARKNLLKGLMEDQPKETPPDAARVNPAKPRYATGAVGAVSQSIADLKSRSVMEIDVEDIDAAGLHDRVEETNEDHTALKASIRDYGQQVPILVRPSPEAPGRYQIVYGRRRLAALKALGLPAKALVRDLDDKALIMAQGQENSARRNLSFIEKCNFARQMRDANYDRKAICDALSVDKTLISRMLSISDRVPIELIEHIGSAPSIGRDRWSAFAERLEAYGQETDTLIGMINLLAGNGDSDQRFNTAFDQLPDDLPKKERKTPTERAKSETLKSVNGMTIGKVTRKKDSTILTLPRGDGFDEWLAENMTEIHRSWFSQRDE
ncbi:MAG: plasmid partitioning protein RepB [Arenibacterium sp.]